MNAFTAGMHGVPMVFLTGDQAAADEVQALVPNCEATVVKQALPSEMRGLEVVPAISLSPEQARKAIREGVKLALGKQDRTEPYYIPPPYELKIQFTSAKFAQAAAGRPGVREINDVTFVMEKAEQPWLLL